MKIAFLGLGNMGIHMARHLLKAGHDVTVWNRTASKAKELEAHGAKAASSPAEAARNAEVAITMLADDRAARVDCLRHRKGSLTRCRKARCIFLPALSAWRCRSGWRRSMRNAGRITLPRRCLADPKRRRPASCLLLPRESPKVIERCKPVLETIGQRLFVMGEKPEMANVVKVSGNFPDCLGDRVAGRGHRAGAQVRHRSAGVCRVLDEFAVCRAGVTRPTAASSPPNAILRRDLRCAWTERREARSCRGGSGRHAATGRQRDSRPRSHRYRPRYGGIGLERNGEAGGGERGAKVVSFERAQLSAAP